MQVQIDVTTVPSEQYGLLLGTVEKVGTHPATREGVDALLNNSDVAQLVVAGSPVIQIEVTLTPSSTTPTGYAWTSGQGRRTAHRRNARQFHRDHRRAESDRPAVPVRSVAGMTGGTLTAPVDAATPQTRRARTPTVLRWRPPSAVRHPSHGAGPLRPLGATGRAASGERRLARRVRASNIVKAARTYGMAAKGFTQDIDALRAGPLPAIVYWNFNHFLVVEGYAPVHGF